MALQRVDPRLELAPAAEPPTEPASTPRDDTTEEREGSPVPETAAETETELPTEADGREPDTAAQQEAEANAAKEAAALQKLRDALHDVGFGLIDHPLGALPEFSAEEEQAMFEAAKACTGGLFQKFVPDEDWSDFDTQAGDGKRRMGQPFIDLNDPVAVRLAAITWSWGKTFASDDEKDAAFVETVRANLRLLEKVRAHTQSGLDLAARLWQQLTPSALMLLLSEPGAMAQDVHTDGPCGGQAGKRAKIATWERNRGIEDGGAVPISFVYAPRGGSILFYPRSWRLVHGDKMSRDAMRGLECWRVMLPADKIGVFRHDVLHAGDSSVALNLRFFSYLDHPDVARPLEEDGTSTVTPALAHGRSVSELRREPTFVMHPDGSLKRVL
jgi:hypothetical protein